MCLRRLIGNGQLRSGPLGSLFRPDTFLNGEFGAGNVWAKGCESFVVRSRNCEWLTGIYLVYTEGK
jgi:tubulin beta